LNNNDTLKKELSSQLVFLYISFILAWAWGFGYLWFIYIKNISFFDTSFFLLLGPLVITLIFIFINRVSMNDVGFIGLNELKKAPNSLMTGMLFIFILVILVLNINISIFFLNLPLINRPETILIYIPFLFLYMFVLALCEESAWSGFLYSYSPKKEFMFKNVFISIIWFIWYIPYLLWVLAINSSFQISIPLLIIFFIQLIPMRFTFSWFREKSHSVYWPSFANGITGTANFIIINLIDILKNNSIIFFSLSAISSTIMTLILYYSFPITKK